MDPEVKKIEVKASSPSDTKRKAQDILIGLVFAMPASVLLRAFTLATLWNWFAVPLGARGIGMVHALGLSLLLSAFKYNEAVKLRNQPDVGTLKYYTRSLVISLAFLVFGWVYHILM